MNILFATFAVFLISTVHAQDFACERMAKHLFKIADELIRLLTVSNTEYKVYRDTIKPYFFVKAFPECLVKFLDLPTELSKCKELVHLLADKPDALNLISIKGQDTHIEDIVFTDYEIDPDELCEVLPKEGELFHNKVKNLVNNGSSNIIVTLDDFCKINTSICNVTDAANIKLVAYLSNGYNPIFQDFITKAQNQDFVGRLSSVLIPGQIPGRVYSGTYVRYEVDIPPLYETCVKQLISFVENKILNS